MREGFKYIDKNFRLQTINKSRTYYYRITKPIEVWGNYFTKISFYDSNNKIVYHRQDCYAHLLSSDNFFGFVKWSKDGNIAFFYEYKAGPVPGDGIYHYIVLLLEENIVYRINISEFEHSYFDNLLDNEFGNTQVMKQLLALNITGEECFTDKITIHPIKWLTGVDRWKPFTKI